jgi:hypothetical protein
MDRWKTEENRLAIQNLSRSNQMAKVQVQVLGGDIKQIEAATVAEAKQQMGVPSHTATVNGEPATDSTELEDYQFVSLSPAVKGGLI